MNDRDQAIADLVGYLEEEGLRLVGEVIDDGTIARLTVTPVDCGCCGGLNEFCVHCADYGGPCPVDGCPIDPSISN